MHAAQTHCHTPFISNGFVANSLVSPRTRRALHEQEQRAAPERMEALQELVRGQVAKEAALQERYKELGRDRDALLRQLQQEGLALR